ncbi:MAG: gamma-glutamyl-gamma-aminobutyrate hydrolase family protein [Chloroflexi bacterium]|nr:gamma-glutamyl-gamma-aminobutyrate hydrolase family protein [Chloroflexota bacterium]
MVSAGEILHGKTSMVTHDGRGVFEGLPNPFEGIRYHSLAIDADSMPEELEVTATAKSGVIMGVRHRTLAVEGVQFHPESIVTVVGHDLLRRFELELVAYLWVAFAVMERRERKQAATYAPEGVTRPSADGIL